MCSVFFFFFFFLPPLSCGKSVKYRYVEFFVFDYDSLPISFQSGIAFPLVVFEESCISLLSGEQIIYSCYKVTRIILISLFFFLFPV